jgi:ADP-ribose pyrophosphatase YjhB (NUDIX family)
MATERRFAAFDATGREGLGMKEIPKDGLCISTFLVINETNEPRKILAGRINPNARWDHIGAVNPGRLQRTAGGWMLPASHLIMLESPLAAVNRILREQLEIDENKAHMSSQPIVFSDVREGDEPHWDIGFIYRGSMAENDLPKTPTAWTELKFVDFDKTPRSNFVRFHDSVIDYAL